MSIAMMTAVWKMDLPPSEKLVMLALADAANDDGVTWMAIRSKRAGKLDFIQKTSLSERTVQTAMRKLEERGLLSRQFRDGKGTIYTVQIEGCKSRGGANDDQTPAAVAPKPSTNRQSKSISRPFPDSWEPTEENLAYAASKGLTPEETERAREDFRGHFIADGKKTSTDWSLNWQRWCRVAADDKHRRNQGQAGKPSAGGHRQKPASMVDIVLERRAAAANQPDLSSDGWLPTDSDGVFVRGPDTGQPF